MAADTKSRRPLRQGLFLLAVINGLVVFAGLLPLEQAAIDVVGVQTEGRVTEHRVTTFGQRTATKAVYAFAPNGGPEVEGQSSFDASPLPPVGSTVQVRYLPFWPEISAYDRVFLRHWGFWAVVAALLILAFVWVALLRKVIRAAGPRSR